MADFRLQSNNLIIISGRPTGKKNMRPADSALGIFRSPDPDLCVPGRRILRPREPWVTWGQKLGHQVKSKEKLVNTLEVIVMTKS